MQWIAYRREYLSTGDGRVRITLDSELQAWDQRGSACLQRHRASCVPRILVVELKCAPADHDLAQALADGLDIPRDRCSKFVTAHNPVDGPPVAVPDTGGLG